VYDSQRLFTFNDILLVPQYSDTEREDVDIHSNFCGYDMSVPVISSPMDSVTDFTVVGEMRKRGGIGIHHRYADEYEMIRSARQEGGIAVSPSMSDKILESFLEVNPNQIAVIDVAHGYTKRNLDFARKLQDMGYKNIISGNIATPDAALAYLHIGVYCLRVGIGSGHVCTTRVNLGVGVPQAYAVWSIYKEIQSGVIISDGGHSNTGDIVKALALGADYVMLGSMLAGCNESPLGTTYRGMASKEAQFARGKQDFVVEGVSKKVDPKGSLKDVLENIRMSIEQACYYLGVRNLQELKGSDFYEITQNSYLEGLA